MNDNQTLPVIKEVKEKHVAGIPPMRKTPNPYVKNMKSLNLSSSGPYKTANGFSQKKRMNNDLWYGSLMDESQEQQSISASGDNR